MSDRTVDRPDESDSGHALLSCLGGNRCEVNSRSCTELRQRACVIISTAQSDGRSSLRTSDCQLFRFLGLMRRISLGLYLMEIRP